jgi:hypothetical protein
MPTIAIAFDHIIRPFGEKLSSRCRSVICQDDLKAELPVMISAIAEFLVSTSGLPSRLATLIALFAIEQGVEDFCDF